MHDRMLAGELYIADDPQSARDSQRAMALTRDLPQGVVAVGSPARVGAPSSRKPAT
jgi:hypothetical protein